MQQVAEGFTRAMVEQWAHDLYANSVDQKDANGYAAAFTPDAWLRFGNNPPLAGREAIRDGIAQFFTAFVSLRHEATGLFLDGDTLTLEAFVTYTRYDGQLVTVPAVTIYHFAAPSPTANGDRQLLADQCRIFVDLAPLFAPTPGVA